MAVENLIDPRDRCNQLEANELTIGTSLMASEYAELLLIYFIRQELIKAKFCYMRAIEKFEKDNLLKQIWTFGQQICKQNFARALLILKSISMDQPALRPYMDELDHRLTATQLLSIEKSYSLISIAKLANLLGMEDSSNAHLQELLQKCAWNERVEENFIRPVMTEEFTQTIASLRDNRYGGMDTGEENAKSAECAAESGKIDAIKSLVDSSIFFDAMSVQAAVEGSGNTNLNSNEQNN